MGDLNKVLNEFKKLGGQSVWKKKSFLRNIFKTVKGIDLGFI